MSVEEAVQNLGSLSITRIDGGRCVSTHPVLDHFKGQAQLLHFFTLLFQELEDVFQSPIFRKSLNLLDVVEPLSFEHHFQFWEHPKVVGSYVGTVRWLAKLYNLVFRQKLLYKVRWMRWRVIVVKKPVTAWLETRSFSSHGITQSFQNFNVIFFVDRLTS